MYLYTKTCLDTYIFLQIEGMYCATEGVEWMQVFVLGRRVHPYIDRALELALQVGPQLRKPISANPHLTRRAMAEVRETTRLKRLL